VVPAAVVADEELVSSSRPVALDRAKPARPQASTPVRSGDASGHSARDVEAAVRRAAIVTEHGRSRIPSAVHLPQHVLAAAGEELMIRFPSERVCPTAFHARKGTNSRLQNLEQQWTKERHYTTHIVRGAKAEEAFPEFIARRGRPLS
jgi:hypothetical protein